MHEIAPVLLKNEGRIEALFTLYFLALLVQAVIERELRLAMKREKIDELPLYPEQRPLIIARVGSDVFCLCRIALAKHQQTRDCLLGFAWHTLISPQSPPG